MNDHKFTLSQRYKRQGDKNSMAWQKVDPKEYSRYNPFESTIVSDGFAEEPKYSAARVAAFLATYLDHLIPQAALPENASF